MKKAIIPTAIVLLLLVTAAGSFNLGARSQRAAFGRELDATQAMQWFNHLLWFREIQSYLRRGCAAAALEKTSIFIDQETRLLSDFYRENRNTDVTKYISDRDPALLGQLGNFKSRYGSAWEEPECGK